MTLNATPIKVGDLLIGRTVFSVPLFQRSYAWGNEQINDFWEDLINTYKENIKEYFLGSMVFTPHQERGKKKILDGQQRLATILLFLAALRDVLKDSSKEEDQQRAAAINEYIYSTDPVSLDKRIKIELNRDDRQFFESIVIHGLIPEARYESHKLMKNAYERFKDKIRERVLEVAKLLRIEDLLDRKPRQLSGGQQQRVALGRAIVRQPKVFNFGRTLGRGVS